MPNNSKDEEVITLTLNTRLALALCILLRKQCRRLEREISNRSIDFVLKGIDVTAYKLQNYKAILSVFPKGGSE